MNKKIKEDVSDEEELAELIDRAKFIYAPNSIWHGSERRFINKETQLKIASDRVDDFLEWLFDVSGYVDCVSQRDAWKEFEEWEIKDLPKESDAIIKQLDKESE